MFEIGLSVEVEGRRNRYCGKCSEVLIFISILEVNMWCFFFSSRRRHTRCSRDWSSDVCSSDLFDMSHGFTARVLGSLCTGGAVILQHELLRFGLRLARRIAIIHCALRAHALVDI